jgi:hypothetical protein
MALHPRRWLVGLGLVLAVIAAAIPAGASPAAPAFTGDLPDPAILEAASGSYYAFSTQVSNGAGGWIDVPVRQSGDGLGNWGVPGSGPDALPDLPSWARSGNTWAPSVLASGPSSFVLYYTVTNDASGLQCISLATSSTPQGPYSDRSMGPLVCQSNLGGSIDPNAFRAPDGTLYLQWKSDDNRFGNLTKLWTRQLSSDGRSFARGSSTHQLLSAASGWEQGIIEGPAMTAVAGPHPGYQYFLMYGAGAWNTPNAGIGYAICSGPVGPCRKVTTTSAWLKTGNPATGAIGPSSPSLYALGSASPYAATQQLAFHGWFCPFTTCNPPTGYYAGGPVRALWINTVSFSGGDPTLQ